MVDGGQVPSPLQEQKDVEVRVDSIHHLPPPSVSSLATSTNPASRAFVRLSIFSSSPLTSFQEGLIVGRVIDRAPLTGTSSSQPQLPVMTHVSPSQHNFPVLLPPRGSVSTMQSTLPHSLFPQPLPPHPMSFPAPFLPPPTQSYPRSDYQDRNIPLSSTIPFQNGELPRFYDGERGTSTGTLTDQKRGTSSLSFHSHTLSHTVGLGSSTPSSAKMNRDAIPFEKMAPQLFFDDPF